MLKYINDLSVLKGQKNLIYVVYEMSEEGTKLIQITKDTDKLLKYNDSMYHMVYKMNYLGRVILLTPSKGIPFKSLIKQQLAHFNRPIENIWEPKFGIEIKGITGDKDGNV